MNKNFRLYFAYYMIVEALNRYKDEESFNEILSIIKKTCKVDISIYDDEVYVTSLI